MRNRTSLLVFCITVFALPLALGGCPADTDNVVSLAAITDASGNNLSGTGSGREWGFHGWVDVELILVDGWITEATVTGPDETPGVGATAILMAPDVIKKGNSVEIDVVASASITTEAIRKAGRQAIEDIIASSSGG
jgi:uncharacterized protein with FMN-binding domain